MSQHTSKRIMYLIWKYSNDIDRERINRALMRLAILGTRFVWKFEEFEVSFMNILQKHSWYNGFGNDLINRADYQNHIPFILYILFENIFIAPSEIVHETGRRWNISAIDNTTRNVCLNILVEIIDHQSVQILFNEMLKWKTNFIDFTYYLNEEKQSNILLSKLIDLLPTKYVCNILIKSISSDIGLSRVVHGIEWVQLFIQCGFFEKMNSILMNENLNQQIKQRSVELLSKFIYFHRVDSELNSRPMICPMNAYKKLNIINELIKYIGMGSSDIVKWSLNAVLNMMYFNRCNCKNDSHGQMLIGLGIIPALSKCLKSKQYLRHTINCIDMLLFIGDMNINGNNKIIQYFKDYGIDNLLRKLDMVTFDAINKEEEI
eukprot:45082_1